MEHVIIGRGKAGWHSDGLSNGNKCSSSGGTLESYLKEAKDGTIIYDADEAEIGSFVEWVMKGPILDVTMAAHEIDRFGADDKQTLLGMLPALKGGFAAVAAMALSDLRSFDKVGLDVYLTAMRERVVGIKIGKVINHQIVWDA